MNYLERKQFYINREKIFNDMISIIEYLFTNDKECKDTVTVPLQAAAQSLLDIINSSNAHPEQWQWLPRANEQKYLPPVPQSLFPDSLN